MGDTTVLLDSYRLALQAGAIPCYICGDRE